LGWQGECIDSLFFAGNSDECGLFGEPQRIAAQATAGKLAVLYDGG